MVDGLPVGGRLTGGMKLRILTLAADAAEKKDLYLLSQDKKQATIVLAENSYFESIENALKIRKYIKQKNVSELPQSVKNIIQDQQIKAGKFEETATEDLKKAIVDGRFYASGERLDIRAGDAKSKIDEILNYLVSHVYEELELVDHNFDRDEDVLALLDGSNLIPGTQPNLRAADRMIQYLEMQHSRNIATTMADIQSRYQEIPYGWREIDIAAVVVWLILKQKVNIKYCGTPVQPDNPKLMDMLRRKSETGKTSIEIRMAVSAQKIRDVRGFLGDYFNEMGVPDDEDGLIKHIVEKFENEQSHCVSLLSRYEGHNFPDKSLLEQAVSMFRDLLSRQKDNVALIEHILRQEDSLYSMKDSLQNIEDFFKTQVSLFDSAVSYEHCVGVDQEYLDRDGSAGKNLDQIRQITKVCEGEKFNYRRIPELNDLMSSVKEVHGRMLDEKRREIIETVVNECLNAIHEAAAGKDDLLSSSLVEKTETYFSQKKQQIAGTNVLTLLDGLVPQMWQYKDQTLASIELSLKPKEPARQIQDTSVKVPEEKTDQKTRQIKTVSRMVMFPGATLETDEDIDTYVERIRSSMKRLLKDCNGIRLN